MEKKHSVFSYLTQVFMIYGISNILLNIFALAFGDEASGLSTIFSLGSDGVGTATCFEFLAAMFVIVGIQYLFTSDLMIRLLPSVARIALLFGLSIGIIVAFIFLFGWFPKDEPLAWIMFGVTFVISFAVSVAVSSAYERSENRKMAEALKKYKEGK